MHQPLHDFRIVIDSLQQYSLGAEWNPGDTVYSGAVFHLIPGADRTQPE